MSDTSPADRDSTGPSKNRRIASAIKDAFRKVARLVLGSGDEAPKLKVRKKRRSGEDARDAIPIAALITAQHRTRQQHVATSVFLSETLDWLHLWQHDPATMGNHAGAFDTISNSLSPRL